MRNVRRLLWVARRLAAALFLLLLAYAAAGLTGGALPANTGWRPPGPSDPLGVTIWVESNGIHTGLVLPKVAAGVDWRGFAPPDDLADPRYGGWDYLSIGWGEHGFYLGTPTWADVRPGTILGAALGSDATLLHVEHRPRPRPGDGARRIVVTVEQYRRLAAYIVASRAAGGQRWAGYGANDVFYRARGRYDAIRTCNSWTGDALRQAGVRIGRWTPFPITVMGWF